MRTPSPANPAIVTQASVRQLPRWTLVVLCLAYVLPGFLARAPWKSADMAAFGVMSAMSQGHTDWWQPTLLGQSLETPALLPYWLGAWAMQWLPMHAELAVRVPFMAALLATFTLTWHAVYRYALLPSAQPVTFAFGAQVQPVDYARSLADGGVLALLACLGLAQLSHETTPAVLQLLGTAALLTAMAHFAARKDNATLWAHLGWLAALVGLSLSGAPYFAIAMSLLPPLVVYDDRPADGARRWRKVTLVTSGIGLTLTVGLLWKLGDQLSSFPLVFDGFDVASAHAGGKLLFWFAWPVWPLAAWTLWRWRKHLGLPHLLGPIWMVAVALTASTVGSVPDRMLLLALPSLALLAAFALPTLKRSVAALIDWFSVVFFSLGALTVWVIWLAMLTGWPAKPAANVARLAPGFSLEFSGLAFTAATIATAAWLWVVRWRIGRHPSALWKSLVLATGGSTLCWLLLMTLWMPLLDFARSYTAMASRVVSALDTSGCIEVYGLTQAQVAGLLHHGKLQLRNAPTSNLCSTLLTTPQALENLPTGVQLNQWRFKARLSRLTDNKESVLLYERLESSSTQNPLATGSPAE